MIKQEHETIKYTEGARIYNLENNEKFSVGYKKGFITKDVRVRVEFTRMLRKETINPKLTMDDITYMSTSETIGLAFNRQAKKFIEKVAKMKVGK